MVITQKEKIYGSQSCQKVVHGLALLYQNCSTIMKTNQEFLFKIKSCKSFFFDHQVYGLQTSFLLIDTEIVHIFALNTKILFPKSGV